MKLAILSDIHGNLPALEAVLTHANQRGAQEYIFTGDIVGHGPDPEACIQRLKNMKIMGIKGNHDKALINNELSHEFYQAESNASLQWAKTLLSDESLKWLKEQLSDGALEVAQLLTVVHGTLMDPGGEYTYMYDNDSNIKMSFRSLKTMIGVFGHTHRPVIYMAIPKPPPFLFSFTTTIPQYEERTDNLAEYVYGYAEDLDMGNRLLVCAGSIGQPRDGDPRASYLVIDDEKQELQYYKLPYTLQKVFDGFEKIRSLFPGHDNIIDECIERLKQGK